MCDPNCSEYAWSFISRYVGIGEEEIHLPEDNLSIFPNPFNSFATISYSVDKITDVEIVIMDLLGQEVNTVFSGVSSSGTHSLMWDGRGENNRILPSGIYFCRVKTNEQVELKKFLIIR
ncbi:T9SS type A sorting domain-containing protein [bacterium]|nr:T9SS type A sorting domain-containing protein [bacterium]